MNLKQTVISDPNLIKELFNALIEVNTQFLAIDDVAIKSSCSKKEISIFQTVSLHIRNFCYRTLQSVLQSKKNMTHLLGIDESKLYVYFSLNAELSQSLSEEENPYQIIQFRTAEFSICSDFSAAQAILSKLDIIDQTMLELLEVLTSSTCTKKGKMNLAAVRGQILDVSGTLRGQIYFEHTELIKDSFWQEIINENKGF